jgi:protein phosphatase
MSLQPDRVSDFCKKNKLQLIIRAHECVMDGFERFAQGQLITLFSATNYCGKINSLSFLLLNSNLNPNVMSSSRDC